MGFLGGCGPTRHSAALQWKNGIFKLKSGIVGFLDLGLLVSQPVSLSVELHEPECNQAQKCSLYNLLKSIVVSLIT